jgi:telomerase reverse transcriptase
MSKKRKRPGKERAVEFQSSSRKAKTQSSSPSDARVQHRVLSQYYRSVTTLRHYLLEQIPTTSKQRRRRIAGLGKKHDQVAVKNGSRVSIPTADGQHHVDDENSQLVQLLDSTLIGVRNKISTTLAQERQRQFLAFTQSEERSLLVYTDTGPVCPQSEVGFCITQHRNL